MAKFVLMLSTRNNAGRYTLVTSYDYCAVETIYRRVFGPLWVKVCRIEFHLGDEIDNAQWLMNALSGFVETHYNRRWKEAHGPYWARNGQQIGKPRGEQHG